ncbi:MAG: hypothetical protein CME70_09735 [Halobacteriovorax sp.]|nr:hypothetical protein [Halobacteriovorax sp.]|tara:strand:- start:125498 stop:126085 length:588 start_codon:yes stop_codon:yes gene_type:complete
MENLLLSAIETFNTFFGNYGLSIIAITLVIKFVTLPLMIISAKSSKKMDQVNKKLKTYENLEPAELAQKRIELFKEHQINPLASILPLLIQAPIYFFLFSVLSGNSFHGSFIWITNLGASDPFFILPILACLSFAIPMFLKKQNEIPQTMKKLQYILPVISFLFLYKMKAAVLLYIATSSIMSSITTWGIDRFSS